MDNQDKTSQIKDWTLSYNKKEECIKLTCHYLSGKSYSRPLEYCRVVPTTRLKGTLLVQKNKPNIKIIDYAEIIGEKYACIYYPNTKKPYLMKKDDVQVLPSTALKNGMIYRYFREIAKLRTKSAEYDKKKLLKI
ncbi:hypothetical protein [Serratia sp. M24T3]|uniref:hypothetical protein n=1 Tax=Serratia sp. M24T3 TaxID=932213 RepID=UPI0003009551